MASSPNLGRGSLLAPELAARVREQGIRTLYRQIPASFAAALVVTVYMAATASIHTPWPIILAWLGVQAASQVCRTVIYLHHSRAMAEGGDVEAAARHYCGYMLMAGLIWASTIVLFADPKEPITIALTLCGLYGISAGSVPGNASNPPGLYLFIGSIFAGVLARMLWTGEFALIVLGFASFFFAGIMVMFCRVQHQTLIDGFLIRFENEDLLAAVIAQKAVADEAREVAEAANIAKSQFLAAASHDLRQPLYALSLLSGALQARPLEPESEQIVDRIEANVSALGSLFEGLLDISRLDAGVITPEIEPVPVQVLFDRMFDYFHAAAIEHGLGLRFRPSAAWVEADAVLLESVVSNLISNGLRYTQSGGVLVAARNRAGRVALEVWDTGIGIHSADAERIFDEFVQVGNAERDRTKGFGLGLAIASRSAALMGTSIELVSRRGRGSMFRITLAPAVPPAATNMVEAAQADLVQGLRVLVLDDEICICEGLSLLLERWGAQVATATTLADAIAEVRAAPFDVALCDYRLAEQATGFDAVEALVAAQALPLAACIITGDLHPEILAEARHRGVHLAHKPLRPAKLRALLNHLATTRAHDAGQPGQRHTPRHSPEPQLIS